MDDFLGAGDPGPEDIKMTNAGDQSANVELFIADINAPWSGVDADDALMLSTEPLSTETGFEHDELNYLLDVVAPGLPPEELFTSVPAAEFAPEAGQEQLIDPAITMGNTLSGPSTQALTPVASTDQTIDSALLESSANMAAASSPAPAPQSTPTSKNSVRRVRAISDNFPPIAPSPTRETRPSHPQGFSAIPPPQFSQPFPASSEQLTTNFAAPEQGFYNENIREFQVSRTGLTLSDLANYGFNQFNGTGGMFGGYSSAAAAPASFDNQVMQPAPTQTEIQPMPQFPNYLPLVAPTNANASTGTNPDGSKPNPWLSGLQIPDNVDPERRAKILEIAKASGDLLNPEITAQAIKQAVDNREAAKSAKKSNKRANDDANGKGGSKAKKARDLIPSSLVSSAVKNNGSTPRINSKARALLHDPLFSTEARIAAFWRGRRDYSGTELPASFLSHGSIQQYCPSPGTWNVQRVKERADQYSSVDTELPVLAESTPIPGPFYSDVMVFSEVMTNKNTQRAVHSGQIVVISYDLTSDWWKMINVWAWNRQPAARCIDEVVIVITPFHIIFGRIPLSHTGPSYIRDYRAFMGVVDKTLAAHSGLLKDKYWSYMYRLIPVFVDQTTEISTTRPESLDSRLDMLQTLGNDLVYNGRFMSFLYCVPPIGELRIQKELVIRVGNFGKKGFEDRPHVQVNDMTGDRVLAVPPSGSDPNAYPPESPIGFLVKYPIQNPLGNPMQNAVENLVYNPVDNPPATTAEYGTLIDDNFRANSWSNT